MAHNLNHGAIVAYHDGGGTGIYGASIGPGFNNRTGAGVVGESRDWVGVYGQSTANAGVWGKSTNGYGVYGESTNSYAGYFEGKVSVKVLEIKGGADLAERFDVAGNVAIAAGSLVVIDAANPGKLKLSDRPYDMEWRAGQRAGGGDPA